MVNRISSLIHQAWSYIPQISKENISSVAQAALKQLPWVPGAAVGYTIVTTTGVLTPPALMAGFILAAGLYAANYLTLPLPIEERTDRVILVVKTIIAIGAILGLGYGFHFYHAAALALKEACVSAALQNGYLGTLIFSKAFKLKTFVENFPIHYRATFQQMINDAQSLNYARTYEFANENGVNYLIPLMQLDIKKHLKVDLVNEFISYLQDHDIEKAVALYPAIFDHSSICAWYDGHADFKKLLRLLHPNPTHRKIWNYIEQKYTLPILDESSLQSLHLSLTKFEQLEALFKPISSLNIERETAAEITFIALRDNYNNSLPEIERLKQVYSPLMQKHLEQFDKVDRISVGQVLDHLGITDKEHRFIERLNKKDLFCLGDLTKANIVACESDEKEAVIQRIKDFLAGKDLEKLPAAQRASPLFNVALTGVTLAIQMYAAPLLTSLGVAYGFTRKDRAITHPVMRLFETIVALDTTTYLGKGFSFMVGINQGKRLRKHFNQVFCG